MNYDETFYKKFNIKASNVSDHYDDNGQYYKYYAINIYSKDVNKLQHETSTNYNELKRIAKCVAEENKNDNIIIEKNICQVFGNCYENLESETMFSIERFGDEDFNCIKERITEYYETI